CRITTTRRRSNFHGFATQPSINNQLPVRHSPQSEGGSTINLSSVTDEHGCSGVARIPRITANAPQRGRAGQSLARRNAFDLGPTSLTSDFRFQLSTFNSQSSAINLFQQQQHPHYRSAPNVYSRISHCRLRELKQTEICAPQVGGLRNTTIRFVFVPLKLLSTPQQFAVFVNF